ncbi:MAG TPA: trypsin-like peptidase domain-containing protein [Anaerolineales bacterium]|nr:trypsin-like peptidase domain-containing protein [Anaerolineales bacterium]
MKKRTFSLLSWVVLGLLVVTACSGVGLTSLNLTNPAASSTATPTLVAPVQGSLSSVQGSDLLSAYQGTLENIYSAVSPSVVNIHVVEKVNSSDLGGMQIPSFPFFNQPQGQQPPQQFQSALGSGFVWDTNGNIVTNNHVVAGADKIEVTFSDGTTIPAKLVGTDPDSDLAVIKVDVGADKLHPVTLADSNAIKVGELAIAIGNPFGLEGTMTTGIISAVGRSLPTDETSLQSYTIPDIIQTDAPINPGNSGGVLIDAQGQVLGVTSAIESPSGSNAGIGFAIPSAIVKNVVPALISDGKYVHSWLGVSGTSLTPDIATAMNLDPAQRGALIEEVLPNSPAEKAGLEGSNQQTTIDGRQVNVGGDVVTAIDDRPILQMDDLIAYLVRSTKVDQKVSLTILRNGKEQAVDVTLAARPSSEERNNNDTTAPSQNLGIHLGILGTNVDQGIAKAMNLPDYQQGVLVEKVEQGSLADNAGLQPGSKSVTINGQEVTIGGDIITALNDQPITSVDDLRSALSQLPADHPLTLTVLRDGKEIQIQVQAGL